MSKSHNKFMPLKMILPVSIIFSASLLCAQPHPATAPEKVATISTNLVTNAPQSVIPKSRFVVPANSTEGKDPFYPKLTQYVSTGVKHTQPGDKPVSPSVELVLKGISGAPNRRIVIINNYSFMAGEEGDVVMGSTRIRVRCIEIKADSVLIEVGGERRELRLK